MRVCDRCKRTVTVTGDGFSREELKKQLEKCLLTKTEDVPYVSITVSGKKFDLCLGCFEKLEMYMQNYIKKGGN